MMNGKISIILGNSFNILIQRKPLIAAVNGYCLGGGLEIALMSDIIIAEDTAVFGLPELPLGIIPGGGGTQRISREVGKSLGMQMLLTGEFINANKACAFGLVSEVICSNSER